MKDKIFSIGKELIAAENRKAEKGLARDYSALAKQLVARGTKAEAVVKRARGFGAAVPSWGTGTGGTRFGRFPIPGLPRDVFEKIDDAATVQALTRANPAVSLHLPWDKIDDLGALKRHAAARGLKFDAMNSNTFEDQPGQRYSYKYGSLAHSDRRVREQAVRHNLEVAAIGRALGSKALSIWIADGSNYPGQMSIRASFERYLESLKKIYAGLPRDWVMYIEYKPFEPAFYYTVLADWGAALMAAQEVGPRCQVLVDLGHHLPGTNVEMVVARLIQAGRLGGFHFNDNKYADDDLTAGSIDPYRLFRVFHELGLESARRKSFAPAYLIDQSHNLKDPIEDLIQTTMMLQDVYVKALLVDLRALAAAQDKNDVLAAERLLQDAFATDVRPLTARARLEAGGALDPLAIFRASGYRSKKADERGG
jgi:L-rhamnose isomerase / sugar isomerase